MHQVHAPDGVVSSFIRGVHLGWEPAPEGFSPDNAWEWVKKNGVWTKDPEEADRIRQEREG